jgi:hypothetical protein
MINMMYTIPSYRQGTLQATTRAIKRYNAFYSFVFMHESTIHALFSKELYKNLQRTNLLSDIEMRFSGGGALNAKRKSSQHLLLLLPPKQ